MPEIRDNGYVVSDQELELMRKMNQKADRIRAEEEARRRRHSEAMQMIGAAEAALDMGEWSEASARALVACALLLSEIAEQ